jgi:hypothetical protein
MRTERLEVGRHHEIDAKPRILEAHRHVAALEHKPVAAGPRPAEVELDDEATRREPLATDAAPHVLFEILAADHKGPSIMPVKHH